MGTDRSKDGAHYFVDVVLGQGEFIYEISCFYVAGIYGSITLQTNVGSYTVQCGRPPPLCAACLHYFVSVRARFERNCKVIHATRNCWAGGRSRDRYTS
jgi:hypothetical protein